MKKSLIAFTACVTVAALLAACKDQSENASQIERRKQGEMSLQAIQSVGMPAIVNFAEKRMMKDIIELRDKNVATTTYIIDMNGKPHKICDSVGFGLPYATQYTNPQMPQQPFGGNTYVLPQADPNGLYSPASADGTWVQCIDPKTKKATVVYIEPHVIVSPFPLGE
jgi:hypothetical protein